MRASDIGCFILEARQKRHIHMGKEFTTVVIAGGGVGGGGGGGGGGVGGDKDKICDKC